MKKIIATQPIATNRFQDELLINLDFDNPAEFIHWVNGSRGTLHIQNQVGMTWIGFRMHLNDKTVVRYELTLPSEWYDAQLAEIGRPNIDFQIPAKLGILIKNDRELLYLDHPEGCINLAPFDSWTFITNDRNETAE